MTDFLEYLEASRAELIQQTIRHLFLIGVAMGVAIAVGVPLGIVVSRRPRASQVVLNFANAMQTIPSLALFGLLIPLPVIGGADARPAIIALMLYALLPIIRNTVTGLRGVDPAVREAARAMGMTGRQMLVRVDLPLAIPVLIAGVRIATVISVGNATIAAAAGAEGLGVFIFRGLETFNTDALLVGAIPAALMAIVIDGLLALVERALAVGRAGETAGDDE